jgi:hypothetical protein
MNKTKIVLGLLTALLLTSCASIYRAPGLEAREAKHKEIAFLPFDAVIKYRKLPKNTTAEQMKEMEEDMGYIFQEQMYTRFLKKINKYNIEFQDISRTNALLKKNNISYSNFKEYTKDELAKLLGVDAVVSGKILTSKPMSTGAAIAVAVLAGVGTTTNKVDVNVSLHDGMDAKLLFNYDHTYSGGLGSNPESLSKALMKHIEKKFPYRN